MLWTNRCVNVSTSVELLGEGLIDFLLYGLEWEITGCALSIYLLDYFLDNPYLRSNLPKAVDYSVLYQDHKTQYTGETVSVTQDTTRKRIKSKLTYGFHLNQTRLKPMV